MRKLGFLLSVISVLCLLAGCAGTPTAQNGTAPEYGVVEHDGERYRPREDLTTILLLGLDKYERTDDVSGYMNKLQSDFMALLILDRDAGTCRMLHINRDTMTEIRRLGIGGDGAGTFVGQIALAHTYGSGGSDSALNAVRAVSTLLGGIRIDHYMTLTMDAVGVLNDLLGGITVTVLDDFTSVDPALQKDAQVTLMGDQALLYVRSRKNLEDSSNLHRMERQRQYMTAFYEKLLEQSDDQADFLSQSLLGLTDSFTSDCTVTELDRLVGILRDCTLEPIKALPGEVVTGEKYMEFHVDETALWEIILDEFYEKVD